MKKSIVLMLGILCIAGATAQRSFTVDNADGVEILYQVTSTDPAKVSVAPNNYSGALVIPATVVWNDTTWTISSLVSTFIRNRPVSYVHLPAGITTLPQGLFYNCTSLDSLRFEAPSAVTVPSRNLGKVFGNDYNYSRPAIKVPCGSLSAYKNYGWNVFGKLMSDCAHRLVVLVTEDSVLAVDSVVVNGVVRYANGWYETGDTAALYYRWANNCDGYMFGWSCGDEYIVNGPDTVYALTNRARYASIAGTNNIATPVSSIGTMSYRYGRANYMVNPGANTSSIFASALWLSGAAANGDVPLVSAHRYWGSGTDFVPGPLRISGSNYGTPSTFETMVKYNHVWHITREMIDYHIAHCGEDGYVPAEDLLTWPGNGDSTDGYAAQLAPYYDADGDGRYIALAGDYPLIRGDEATFSIFNDYISHNATLSSPMYLEVHCMSYVFNEPQDIAMQYTLFQHYDIYNRSANDYSDFYLGAWTDFDLGYAHDDFVGSDVLHGMYYCYNGDETDGPGIGSFSGIPPAQSCTFLGGALIPADGADNAAINEYPGTFTPGDTYGNMGINGFGFGDGIVDNERMGMTNFVYYNNSSSGMNGEPKQAADYYNLMRSHWKDGTHVKYGTDGLSGELDANFMFPNYSDPWHWGTDGITPTNNPDDWNERTAYNMPSDRRGVGTSGPFNFVAGSMQQLDLAYTTAWGETDAWSSVDALGRATSNICSQFYRDTTASGKPFVYAPYSAPHVVGIAPVSAEATVNVYPNPTSGTLRVSISQGGASEVNLFDMMGRKVMSYTLPGGTSTIDISRLPQGVYILRTGSIVKRIVKQ